MQSISGFVMCTPPSLSSEAHGKCIPIAACRQPSPPLFRAQSDSTRGQVGCHVLLPQNVGLCSAVLNNAVNCPFNVLANKRMVDNDLVSGIPEFGMAVCLKWAGRQQPRRGSCYWLGSTRCTKPFSQPKDSAWQDGVLKSGWKRYYVLGRCGMAKGVCYITNPKMETLKHKCFCVCLIVLLVFCLLATCYKP